MTVETSQSKSETLSPPVTMILNRIRCCAYLTEISKTQLAKEVVALSRDDRVTLLNHLPEILSADNYAYRANALFAIGLFGPQARFALPGIIESMDCWNCKVVVQVADTLTNIGATYAVPALLGALRKAPPPDGTSLQWTIQDEYILEIIETFGTAAESAAPALAAYLHFHNSANQALISIGAAAIPAILDQVERATKSRLNWVSHNAAEIISAIGIDITKQLVQSFEASTPEGRLALLSMVSMLRPPALSKNAIPWLRQLLRDDSFQSYAERALHTLESYKEPVTGASDKPTVILNMVHSGKYLSESSKLTLSQLLRKATASEQQNLLNPLCEAMQSGGGGCARRANAIYVLGLLGPQAGPAVPSIIEAMLRVNCRGVIQAADALAKIGASYAVPELIKALNPAPNPSSGGWSRVNECIMVCLESFGPALSSEAPLLALCLDHGSVNTVLASIGPAAISPILDEVKRQIDGSKLWRTCRFAAEALSAIGAPASRPLIEALASSTAKNREAISLLFSHLKPPALSLEAVPALCRLYLSNSTDIRNNATKALHALGPAAAPATGEFIADYLTTTPFPPHFGHPNHSYGAASAYIREELLKESGLSAIPALTARLSHNSPEIQSKAAAWILRINPDDNKAVAKLLSLLANNNEQVRLLAIEAVIQARGNTQNPLPTLIKEKLLPAVIKAWQDPNSAVRRKACEALAVMITDEALSTALGGVSSAVSSSGSGAGSGSGSGAGSRATSLAARFSLIPNASAPTQSNAPESELPPMPTYIEIKEALESQFPKGMVVSRRGYQVKNANGGYENRVEEHREPISFTAQQLQHPLSGNNPGQPTFFKRHIMLSITAGQEFRWSGGLGGHGRGLYAYDGQKLTYVDGADACTNVGAVLRVEALKLDQADPVELCWFFCQTLIMSAIGQHTVVEPSASPAPGAVVTKPSVTVTKTGWKAHFWTLKQPILGCCRTGPVIPELCEHTVTISPQFDIAYEEG